MTISTTLHAVHHYGGATGMTISTTLHGVQSITATETISLGNASYGTSYFRVLKVVTEDGEVFDLTLFSPDPDALTVREEH